MIVPIALLSYLWFHLSGRKGYSKIIQVQKHNGGLANFNAGPRGLEVIIQVPGINDAGPGIDILWPKLTSEQK